MRIPNYDLPGRILSPTMLGMCLGIFHAVDIEREAKRRVGNDVRPPKANARWRPIHKEAGFYETNESILAWAARQDDCTL